MCWIACCGCGRDRDARDACKLTRTHVRGSGWVPSRLLDLHTAPVRESPDAAKRICDCSHRASSTPTTAAASMARAAACSILVLQRHSRLALRCLRGPHSKWSTASHASRSPAVLASRTRTALIHKRQHAEDESGTELCL